MRKHLQSQQSRPKSLRTCLIVVCAWSLVLFAAAVESSAQSNTFPGVSESEIRLGQTVPYSGPASAFATIGRAHAAYFDMINAQGGIGGRRIKLISLDDEFSPPKTVEQTRRLVEGEEVLALFNSLGPGQMAVLKYVNEKHVPDLFVGSGSPEWDDPSHYPWSMGFQPEFEGEGRAFARYIVKFHPNSKIGVYATADGLGRDGLRGMTSVLGAEKVARDVTVVRYDRSDPTVDSALLSLRASGADVLVTWISPTAASQAIRKLHELRWHPTHLTSFVTSSVESVLKPAGLSNAVGTVTTGFLKQPLDPAWASDPGVQEFLGWMRKYYPTGDPADIYNAYAYTIAQTMTYVLRNCGSDYSRDNVMRQAANIRDLSLPLLLPGIKVNTSPSNYRPIRQIQLLRFTGERWAPVGDIITP